MAGTSLPSHAHVVIIGGGVIGCSVAYHLTRLGVQEVVVLERKKLTCGTTWHAAGLLTTLRDTESQTKLAKYTQELYDRLEEETGQATGFMRCGSIQIAESPEKAIEMRRGTALARVFGVENEEISPAQMQEMWPLADVSDVHAAFYFPKDGRANPTDVTQALMKGATQKGALLFEDTAVTGILIENRRAVGVQTERGPLRSEYVVNCGGMWAREIGQMAGVDVPLQAAEHYYLISEPIEGVRKELPILRNPEKAAYVREEPGSKILLGFFEPVAAPWGMEGIPEGFCFDELPPDWDRMEPHIEKAMKRIPALLDVGIRQFFCGPESFTPDHNYLMGEAPNLENFFVAAGFNSLGILSGGVDATPLVVATEVAIIMLTENTNTQHVVDARNAGVDEFLAKPITAKVLHSRLLSIVENPRLFVRSPGYIGPDRRYQERAFLGQERRHGAAADTPQRNAATPRSKQGLKTGN